MSIGFDQLPAEILDSVLCHLSQHLLTMMASTCSALHSIVLPRLYHRITVVNDSDLEHFTNVGSVITGPVSSPEPYPSYVAVSRIASLVRGISFRTLPHVRSIEIQSQSEGHPRDYESLYAKLYGLWDKCSRPIFLANFDMASVRYTVLLNAYILLRLGQYWEDECHSIQTNNKAQRLTSWLVKSQPEWTSMPRNPNLSRIDVFIEHGLTQSAPAVSALLASNLEQLSELYLHTPVATRTFFETAKALNSPLHLKTLLLTASHSVGAENSMLDCQNISECIRLNTIQRLEWKVNCMRPGCDCIESFFGDWITNNGCESSHATDLALLNYKSCPLKSNVAQFSALLANPRFFQLFSNVQRFYLNVCELGVPCPNGAPRDSTFDVSNVVKLLQYMPQLQHLSVPDFMTHWPAASLARSDATQIDQERAWFDKLLNRCQCQDCARGRLRFRRLAKHKSDNTFAGDDILKSLPVSSLTTLLSSSLQDPSVAFTTAHISFYNFLVMRLKGVFRIQHKNLFALSSILDAASKPMVDDPELDVFAQLFWHNSIGEVAEMVKKSNSNLRYINLGGIRACCQ